MLNFFREDPFSLTEIRQLLDEQSLKSHSLTTLLEKHHEFMEESLPTLMDKVAPIDEKQMHLSRFLRLLKVHSRAEEETLYPALLEASEREAHIEGLVGIDEHDIIHHLADELKDSDFETYWAEEVDAKARVLATLVQNHMLDEERTTFNVAKRDLNPEVLESLASDYIEKCKHYLDLEIIGSRKSLNAHEIQRSL